MEQKKRVAIYCRVSTEFQDTSIVNQQQYFEDYLARHDEYILYKYYIDEGISGTDTKKRNGFNQMITDGKANKYDVLISKSFSRFGRNQIQCLQAINDLREKGIRAIFIEDGLDSEKDVSTFGLFSWLYQQEAHKTSERIKLTWDTYNQSGKLHACRSPYGYDYDKATGDWIINQDEAVYVRKIFNMYLNEGYGCTKIANILNETGVKTKRKGEWANNTIRKIITNPVYIGTLIQGKSRTIDVVIKKSKKIDEKDWYVHENRFEAIIDEETFYLTQEEIKRRGESKYERRSSSALFSTLIKCGECGSTFTIKRQKHFRNYSPYYTCIEYERKGVRGCGHSRITIYENELIDVIKDWLIYLSENNYKPIKDEWDKADNSISKEDLQKELVVIKKLLDEANNESLALLKLYTKGIINDNQYQMQNEQYQSQLETLTKEKENIENKIELNKVKRKLDSEIINIMDKIKSLDDSDWTNGLLRQIIEKIEIVQDGTVTILPKRPTQ